jgi:hypothetical protein
LNFLGFEGAGGDESFFLEGFEGLKDRYELFFIGSWRVGKIYNIFILFYF